MLKLTAVVSLMLIVTWSQADSKRQKKEATASGDFEPGGSTLWAASLSCDSCGSECAAACGTRHFRSCCFNYLRRKRGAEPIKFWPQNPYEQLNSRLPLVVIEKVPAEPWMTNLVSSDFKPYPLEETLENRLPIVYDA